MRFQPQDGASSHKTFTNPPLYSRYPIPAEKFGACTSRGALEDTRFTRLRAKSWGSD